MRLKELAASGVRYGYRRLHVLLQWEGWRVNHERLYRLCSEEGLSIRTRCRRARRYRSGHAQACGMNDVWTMDFMSDKLFDGQYRTQITLPLGVLLSWPPMLVTGTDFRINLLWSRCISPRCLVMGILEAKLVNRLKAAKTAVLIVCGPENQTVNIPVAPCGVCRCPVSY